MDTNLEVKDFYSQLEKEMVEVQDDQRCAECGSTEMGNCWNCKDGI